MFMLVKIITDLLFDELIMTYNNLVLLLSAWMWQCKHYYQSSACFHCLAC